MRKSRQLSILFLFVFSALVAQNENSIELISVSQGLPNSHITKLFFGKKNLFWIGTSDGVCFFDGYNFNVLQSSPFDTSTLADDNIISITQDEKQNIWLLTHYGIELIDLRNNQKKRIKFIPELDSVRSLISSKAGDKIYVVYNKFIEEYSTSDYRCKVLNYKFTDQILDAAFARDAFWIINNQNIVRIDLTDNLSDAILPLDLRGKNKNAHIQSWGENLIFSIGRNLYLFEIGKTEATIVYTAPDDIISISNSFSGQLALATQNKVINLRHNPASGLFVEEILLNGNQFLINQIIIDRNGLFWAATDKGIVKINRFSKYIRHSPYSAFEIAQARVKHFIIESNRKGFIYFTEAGETQFFNTTKNTITNLPVAIYTSACNIDDIYLLAGHKNGLIKIDLRTGKITEIQELKGLSINSIEHLDEEISVATNRGVYYFNGSIFQKHCDTEILKFILSGKEIYYTNYEGFGVLDKQTCKQTFLLTKGNSSEFVQILDLIQSFDGKIWLATDDGLYRFNPKAKAKSEQLFKLIFKGRVYALIEAGELPEIWFSTDMGIGSIDYRTEQMMVLGYEDGVRLTSFIPTAAFSGPKGEINFLTTSEILSFHPDSVFRNSKAPSVYLAHADFISKNKREVWIDLNSDTIIIKPDVQYMELAFTTLDYYAPHHTRFEYSLVPVGKNERWEKLTKNILSLGGVKPGSYTLNVKAINSHGYQSVQTKKMHIVIKAPIHRSNYALLGYIILLAGSIILLIRFRTRNLIRINREYKEKERIARKIEQQKEELTLKNKNITDSINYARRIQLAMMPSAKIFKKLFPDSFVLHMPKDIVSGDFYWINKINNRIFFSAVDCTGHGVPGAFMSIIGVELFRRITEIENIYTPAEVLNSLSKNFDRVFGDVEEMKLRDGMDLSFCSIGPDFTSMEFSGAFNPLYIIRDSSIIEVKGDRQSVGVIHEGEEKRSFTNHVLPLQDQDLIYIFTDGFADQFGGPEGKKYKYRRFRHLLLALHQLPMEKQEDFLRKSINEWKGNMDQVDDILVIGIRIHQKK